jgi:hypothetical protein
LILILILIFIFYYIFIIYNSGLNNEFSLSPHDDTNLNTLNDKELESLKDSVGKTFVLGDNRECIVQSVDLEGQTVTCSIIETIPLNEFRDELAPSGGSKSRKHRSNKRKGKKSYRKKKYGKSKKIRRFRRSVKSRR